MRGSMPILAILLSVPPALAGGNVHMFDMKTGLWRFTLPSDMSPASKPSSAALAQMSPMQRMVALAVAKAQAPKPIVYQSCITKADLVHAAHITMNDEGESWGCPTTP